MRILGNIIWFLFGGIFLGLSWWILGILMYILIITIPFGKASFVIGNFCFFPFGKELISRKELSGKEDIGTGALGLIGNIIWVIVAGIWLCIGHAIAGILCCITIIGIPFGIQHFKIAGASFAPIGKTVVTKEVAAAALKANAEAKVDSYLSRVFKPIKNIKDRFNNWCCIRSTKVFPFTNSNY